MDEYVILLEKVKKLQEEGKLPKRPTLSQYADFAYGNAKLENPKITREMALKAAYDKIKDIK